MDTLRLFFALWPDPAVREQLAKQQQHISGRRVPADNLHLTLAFLGVQPRSLLPSLEAALDTLALPALQLTIDRLGYFSKPRIAWAGPSTPPAALMSMQQGLWKNLAALSSGLTPPAQFTPHVTLARAAAEPDTLLANAVIWQVNKLALLSSANTAAGLVYTPLATRALAAI